ncbi:MAG TPA: hypothetical protein VFB59_05680 [Candidatus Saccharimonadales bacterium]|nr:hypothetical protein [Candidatus Saccharimonadales bacterium]
MTLGTYDQGGLWVPRWLDRATEFNRHSVIESGIHPEHSGVGLIKSYDVFDVPARQKVSIEEAKELGGHCMTFLISTGWLWQEDHGTSPIHMVTSSMGSKYTQERPITVRRPRDYPQMPLMHVEMLDIPGEVSDEGLLERHTQRLKRLNFDYQYSYAVPRPTQMKIDETYLYISHD